MSLPDTKQQITGSCLFEGCIEALGSLEHMSTFGQPRQKFADTGEFGTFEYIIMDPSVLATNLSSWI